MIQLQLPGAPATLPSAILHAARSGRRVVPPLPRRRVRRRSPDYESVWISDLHLGTPGCKARELLEFLRSIGPRRLYLVGDVIDGWSLAREPYWPAEHQAVLERCFELSEQGTEVTYVTGNHDEELRALGDTRLERLRLVDLALHTTLAGRRLVVVHGDRYDGVTTSARWLAELGDRAYALTLAVNDAVNRVSTRAGLGEVSFSLRLKQSVKALVNRVNRWEQGIAAEIRRHGAQGLVCGHVHKPEIGRIGDSLYLNDGDWVESRTALVERSDGTLELGRWDGARLVTLDAAS